MAMTAPTPAASSRCIQAHGLDLQLDPLDSLGLLGGQPFEPELAAALQRCVLPGQTVVDVGANIGYFSLLLAQLVGPAGHVHAIEPAPANFDLLQRNVRVNRLQQVQLHQLALGEKTGVAQLHLSTYNHGMHRLYPSVCNDGATLPVPVQRLDQLLPKAGVDAIKIDVEGYELPALLGAEQLLRANPAVKIFSEYCPPAMLEAGLQPAHFLSYLQALGFVPHILEGQAVSWDELWADAQCYVRAGREAFVQATAGKTNPEILEAVQRLAQRAGCHRPVIENLLFFRL